MEKKRAFKRLLNGYKITEKNWQNMLVSGLPLQIRGLLQMTKVAKCSLKKLEK